MWFDQIFDVRTWQCLYVVPTYLRCRYLAMAISQSEWILAVRAHPSTGVLLGLNLCCMLMTMFTPCPVAGLCLNCTNSTVLISRSDLIFALCLRQCSCIGSMAGMFLSCTYMTILISWSDRIFAVWLWQCSYLDLVEECLSCTNMTILISGRTGYVRYAYDNVHVLVLWL